MCLGAALLLVAGCGGDDDDGGGPTSITGSLVGQSGGCPATTVRVVTDSGSADFEVDADCRFAATVEPNTYSYVQLLADGTLVATMAWQDPTVLNDGMTLAMTSWLKLPDSTVHDLDEVFVIDLEGNVDAATVTKPSYAGSGGLLVAWPFAPPLGYDADGNGLPDDTELGFVTGSDTTGDGVPESPAAADCDPGSGPLYGELTVTLLRDGLGPDELQEIMDAGAPPPGITLMADGFTRGPLPARGAWVTINDEHAFIADELGVVTIDSVPEGVATAKVYRSPGDKLPYLYLPLCTLGTDPFAPPVIDHMRIYPDPCHMQSTAAAECRGDSTDEENDEFLEELGATAPAGHAHHEHDEHTGAGDAHRTHKACTGTNYPPCCLDYDGYDNLPGKPHGARAFVAYWGSTCERYVDANCCINEGGTIGGRLAGGLGLKQLTNCWRNHKARNCQTINLDGAGLVLSTDPAVRDAHDPSTSPESITINCGSTLTLYHYNNTCQNEDRIFHIGDQCGTLEPKGVLQHTFMGRTNVLERDLTFTAPDTPCQAKVKTFAWGFSREVEINVVCEGSGTGACCYTNGDCADGITSGACSESGGTYSAGASCDAIGCGACCHLDESCTDNQRPDQCVSSGDRYVPGGQCANLVCNDSGLVQAVVLDVSLGSPAAYMAGDVVEVSRMSGGFVAGPDVGCPGADHYHSDGPVFIDGINGPYADPARENCGFGKVIWIPAP